MKAFAVLLKTEMTLAVREFSGVLFGLILPAGIMLFLGALINDPILLGNTVPAVMAVGICATGLMGLPLSVALYREKKILKGLQVTPIGPLPLLAAQFVSNGIVALLSSAVVLWIAAGLFGYRFRGDLLSFLGAYGLVTASIYAVGMFLASVSGSVKNANLLCSLFYFPMFFLSGATVPYEIMPAGLQRAADILPLTQGVKLLKGTASGALFSEFSGSVILLLVVALVGTAGAIRFFRWE